MAAVVLGDPLTAALTVSLAHRTLVLRTAGAGCSCARRPRESPPLSSTALAAAEDAFHSVCNTGYADLQGLLEPGTVIADYPADGPAFSAGPDYQTAERGGTGTLTVETRCPQRRLPHHAASGGSSTGTPLGAGRSLAVRGRGSSRGVEGRPAHLDDPPAGDPHNHQAPTR